MFIILLLCVHTVLLDYIAAAVLDEAIGRIVVRDMHRLMGHYSEVLCQEEIKVCVIPFLIPQTIYQLFFIEISSNECFIEFWVGCPGRTLQSVIG